MPPKKGAASASSSDPKPTERRITLPGSTQSRVVYMGSRGGTYVRHKNQFVPVSQLANKSKPKSKPRSKPKSKPRRHRQRGGAPCHSPQDCYDAFIDQYDILMGDADKALRHIEEHRDLNDSDVMNEYVDLVHVVLDDIADAKTLFSDINVSNSQEGESVRLQRMAQPKLQELLDLETALNTILNAHDTNSSNSAVRGASVSFQDWVNNRR